MQDTRPTPAQTHVLLAAVHNGHRLPGNCLAYGGVFVTYGGAEAIQAALAAAAKTRSHRRAVEILRERLDFNQLLMAGGFLHVERDSFRDSSYMLADRYATAIFDRTNRIPGVTVQPVAACVRHGWLDDKWRLTEAGRTAIATAEPHEYLVSTYYALRDEHVDAGGIAVAAERVARDGDYEGAIRWLIDARGSDFIDEGAELPLADAEAARRGVTARAADRVDYEHPLMVVNMVVDEAAEIIGGTVRAGKNNVTAVMDTIMRAGRDHRVLLDRDTRCRFQYPTLKALEEAVAGMPPALLTETMLSPREENTDLDQDNTPLSVEVAAAMTATDLTGIDGQRRTALVRHGILPQTFARLFPPVASFLVDELRPAFAHAAGELVAAIRPYAGPSDMDPALFDPCGDGYRISVHIARRDPRHPEPIRKALLHLELALTSAAHGHRGIALAGIAKTEKYVGQYTKAA